MYRVMICFLGEFFDISLWVQILTGTLDSFMWGSYPASLRNVGGSTQVPVRAWNNARRGTWGLPPPVKLERRDMTYTVSMWRKTQNKTKNKKFICMRKMRVIGGLIILDKIYNSISSYYAPKGRYIKIALSVCSSVCPHFICVQTVILSYL
jgi:hypothetical protein